VTIAGAQIFRYATTGLINTVIGLLVIILLQSWAGWSSYAANAGGYLAGIGSGFLLNRRWTFERRSGIGSALIRYVAWFLACYALNVTILWVGLEIFHWPAAPTQVAAIAAYSVAFYFACKVKVFYPPDPVLSDRGR
jgi:putative flippase GtrA